MKSTFTPEEKGKKVRKFPCIVYHVNAPQQIYLAYSDKQSVRLSQCGLLPVGNYATGPFDDTEIYREFSGQVVLEN
jgi:hypothetical protein